MSGLGTRSKDPDATLDYSIVWKQWLTGAETIATSDWEVSPDDDTLVIENDSQSTIDTTVWLSGGVLGVTYTLTNRVVTNSTPPRTDDRSFQILIAQQ